MQISIKFTGLNQLIRNFKQAPRVLDEEIKTALNQSIALIQRNVKLRTPVDFGRLRASIGGGAFKGGAYPMGYGIRKGKRVASIGTNVKYAHWVEVRPARHTVGTVGYFRKGVKASLDGITKLFEAAMKRVGQRLTK